MKSNTIKPSYQKDAKLDKATSRAIQKCYLQEFAESRSVDQARETANISKSMFEYWMTHDRAFNSMVAEIVRRPKGQSFDLKKTVYADYGIAAGAKTLLPPPVIREDIRRTMNGENLLYADSPELSRLSSSSLEPVSLKHRNSAKRRTGEQPSLITEPSAADMQAGLERSNLMHPRTQKHWVKRAIESPLADNTPRDRVTLLKDLYHSIDGAKGKKHLRQAIYLSVFEEEAKGSYSRTSQMLYASSTIFSCWVFDKSPYSFTPELNAIRPELNNGTPEGRRAWRKLEIYQEPIAIIENAVAHPEIVPHFNQNARSVQSF